MIEIEQIFNGEREREILREAMERLGLSAEATVRYWCRMGQLVDHHIQRGYKLAWVKNGEVVDPFDIPKTAPACTCAETDGRQCPTPLHQPAIEDPNA